MNELEILRKVLNVETKDLGARIVKFRASDELPDRDGDIIRSSGWQTDNWRKNPVFLWGHARGMPPLGKGVEDKKAKKGLNIDVIFAEAGKDYDDWPAVIPSPETVYRMYKGGFMNAVSVGFVPLKHNQPTSPEERQQLGLGPWGVEYLKQDLLELSAVTVPANPNALQLALTSGLIEEDQAQVWTKLLQDPTYDLIEKCASQIVDIVELKVLSELKELVATTEPPPPALTRAEIEELVAGMLDSRIKELSGTLRPPKTVADAVDDVADFKRLWKALQVGNQQAT